jgi:diaminopimelate decarboxylase
VKRTEKLDIKDLEFVDVVGPICEPTDFFAKDRAIPPVNRGDLIAIFTAGAYGFTMASNYNARPMPAEVLVDGKNFKIIRKRQSYEDMVALEK